MALADLLYGENYKEEIELKHTLEEKIARSLGVPAKQVLLNYGANSNLLLFFSTLSAETLYRKKRRVKVLLDYPNYFFTLHQIKQWHINPVFVKRDDNFILSTKEFISKIKNSKPDVVVITTPNNPTGKPISDVDLELMLKAVPKETIVLVDRACINTLPEITSQEILRKHSNKKIVITHSFSKSHSLSDQRLGFMATNSEEIANLMFSRADLNHNLHALNSLKDIIDNKSHVAGKKKIIRDCNQLLKKTFKKLPGTIYYESHSNFALIKLPPYLNAAQVFEYMKTNDVLIMGGHKIGLGEEYIRIHMSGLPKIKRFIELYESLLNL